MNKKWVAVLAAMAVTAAAFAAKFPSYLEVIGTTVTGVKNQKELPANLIIPNGVTKIGGSAFRDCTLLASVTIPDSVTEIGGSAFRDCISLASVTIPTSVTQISGSAFSGCTSLASVTIPDGVTRISNSAFYNCMSLTSVTIPASVTAIDGYAFGGCTSLATVTISASVTAIGYGAFDSCTSLKEIQFKGTTAQWRAIQGSSQIQVPVVRCSDGGIEGVPEYLKIAGTTVTGYAGTVPANIVIPDSVTAIGERAFDGCTSLTTVTIADGVTGIGGYAFGGCTSLAGVTIPASVTAIDDYAFSGCASLTEIQFKGTTAQWRAIRGRAIQGSSEAKKVATIRCSDGSLSAEEVPEYLKMDGTKITGYTGTVPANLVIPDGVTEIERGVLSGCFDIESVTIPGSVLADAQRSVQNDVQYELVRVKFAGGKFSGMFSDCTYLERVTILDGAVRIPFYMCYNCTSLKSVAIPQSVTEIDSYAFYECTSLTAVEIPDGVTLIADGAFAGCTSLASVTIPDGVTAIGDGAFQDCASLKSITIPRGVTKIGEQAFHGCTSLKSVTIPRGMKAISTGMFYECTSLASVSIPRSVTQIGDGAFAKCSPNLKIQYDGTKAQWNAISGSGKPKTNIQCSDGTL